MRDGEHADHAVGQDERRMQVRAYNHWASLLDNRNFPALLMTATLLESQGLAK